MDDAGISFSVIEKVIIMSLSEVAEIAGVSKSTVSRVINNRPGPSSDTIEAVRKVMNDVGFKPNPPLLRSGRPLGNKRNMKIENIVLMVLGTAQERLKGELGRVIEGIDRGLNDDGLNMILKFVPTVDDIPAFVSNGKIDGLLLMGYLDMSEPIIKKLNKIPAVWIMHYYGGWGDHILPDSEKIGSMSADYLYQKGHRRFAAVTSAKPGKYGPFESRIKRFKQKSEELGVETCLFISEKYDTDALHNLTSEMAVSLRLEIKSRLDELLKLSPLPSGIFVPSGMDLMIVHECLLRNGITPNKDVHIIGACDPEYALMLHPQPAVFDMRGNWIGRRAVDQLLWRIENPTSDVVTKTLFEPKLIEPAD
jgi:LacI family transcriptional regulator